MKSKFNLLLLSIALIAFIAACGGDKDSPELGDKLPEMTIEIPAELENNDAAVAHIKEGEKLINSFSNEVEKAFDEIAPYMGKTEEDLSTMEQIKLAGYAAQLMTTFGSHTLQLGEYLEKSETLQNDLDEEVATAFAIVTVAFEKRMEELGKKYEEFETKQSAE